PDEIATAISAARAAGHHVTVLTGRPPGAAQPMLARLQVLPGPYSVNHGAMVVGPGGEVLKRRRMPADAVRAILSPPLLHEGVPFAYIADDVLHVNDPSDPRWSWAHTAGRAVARFEIEAVRDADKIVFGGNGSSNAIEAQVRAAFDVTTYAWDDGNLEITATDADKGAALALIAERLGVPRRDTVAFGDGANDVTMLAWAGRGVAVGPRPTAEVLAVADERIAAPEALGVADWLAALLR
ncbi:MAG: HAD-IIB family hydrolase, partial [Jiangellaceae bacterium]